MDEDLGRRLLEDIRGMDPVHVLSDRSLPDARRFGFESMARTLAKILLDPGNRTPLTIGIHGAWGSGKTTLMETTRKIVDSVTGQIQESGTDLRKCRTVWFNAWKYAGEEAVLAALVEEILNQMKREGFTEACLAEILELKEKLKWVSLASFLPKILSGGILQIDQFVKESELKKRLPFLFDFQRFLDLLLRFYVTGRKDEEREGEMDDREGVLAVFVDDLDRCQPDRVVELLGSLKLFMDKPACIFVLGMDTKIVERAVEARYSELKGFEPHLFMSKILQVSFSLFPIRGEEIESYVKEDLKVGDPLEKYLHFVSGAIERNPREVKRFVNRFTIQRSLAAARGLLGSEAEARPGRMSEELLAKWTVLDFAFEDFIEWVKRNPLRIVQVQEEIKRWWAARSRGEEPGKPGGYELPEEYRQFLPNDRLEGLLMSGQQFPNDEETISLYVHYSAAVALPRAQGPAARTVLARLDETVHVPAGEFIFGPEEYRKRWGQVSLPDFSISVYPVTNSQYAEFVAAANHRAPEHWQGGSIPEGLEDHPVVNVSWHDARAYCEWKSEKTGAVYRLPTEAEWEKAARGTDGRTWPWGNEFNPKKCNTIEDGGRRGTTPVTEFPEGRSPYGCYDMAGNVWEWTSSLAMDYPYNPDDGREDPNAGGRRVRRGGSCRTDADLARCASRDGEDPDLRYVNVGFRCVVVPQSSPQK